MRVYDNATKIWKAGGILVALLGFVGCSSTPSQPYNQYLASWKGKPEQELVVAFGIPDKSHVMAGGSRVLEYSKTESGRLVCTTRFTITSGGRVDGWWYKGTDCNTPSSS